MKYRMLRMTCFTWTDLRQLEVTKGLNLMIDMQSSDLTCPHCGKVCAQRSDW